MRKFMLFLLAVCMACPVSAITPGDREFLIHAVSSAYPDVGMAGRVGIVATVLHRMNDEGFPDTAADVITYFGDGCFIPVHSPDSKLLRITEDALELVLQGADPTDGALYFRVLDDGSPVYDLKFDNSGEKRRAREAAEGARTCTVAVDGVGFSPFPIP